MEIMATTQQVYGFGGPQYVGPSMKSFSPIEPNQSTITQGFLPWNTINYSNEMDRQQTPVNIARPVTVTQPTTQPATTATTQPATTNTVASGASGAIGANIAAANKQSGMSYGDLATVAPTIQQGMSSGTWGGVGSGIGLGIGAALGGPVGAMAGSAIGGVGGGILDMWLNSKEKEKQEKRAKEAEKEQKRWQQYQLAMEERGRMAENEQAQYARDDAAYERLIAAQNEAIKTKNAIMQSGNLYNARKGRNWYGPQGITAQVRGGNVPTGTTARDLGYNKPTFESVNIPVQGLGV